MKLLQIILGCMIVSVLFTPQLMAQYYYSHGQKLPLRIDSLKICIKFDALVGQDDQASILNSIGRIDTVLVDKYAVDGFIICSLSSKDSYDTFLDSVKGVEGTYLVEPYYLTDFYAESLVGNRFCVAFELSVSKAVIDSINASFGTEIQYEFEGMPNVFVLLNNPSTGYEILNLANTYYELPQTRYAHPLFGVRVEQNSYQLFDFYHNYQPHLKKVIGEFNMSSVWDFAGLTDNVTVAVLDDGVDNGALGAGEHVDLPASRVLPGRNFAYSVLPPVPQATEFHGMACAGIIGATHTTDSLFGLDTNSGVISMAPHVQILPVKIFDVFDPVVEIDSLANAINYAWQNGAGVLSNSWDFAAPCPFGYDCITNAISNAVSLGRGGKGCPVIFSSGNSSQFAVQYPACLSSSFAVGAVRLDDSLWYYSQYGDSLDIVAPSGDATDSGDVWTIDQMGKDGANHPGPIFTCQPGHPEDGDYICNFGGTSAAAPIVSGVAALLISKDSNLTALEVYDILRFSAVTELDSDTITPPDTAYGYGRVDAFRAILSISRGDLDNDDNIGTNNDLTFMVDYIFRGGPLPFPSPLMGDCNCDGDANNVVDMTFLVDFIYRGSGIPPINLCFEF